MIFTLIVLATVVANNVVFSTQSPPASLGRPYEKPENRTMDDLITSMLGGVDVASNMILADNGQILAELDMYLTEKQFLGLYEPPKQADMVRMGMMPNPENYPYEYNEDSVRSKRKAAEDVRLRWTDAVMPYIFADKHFDNKEVYMMLRSMTEWERYTCMRFEPATESHSNAVRFQNGVGCNSQLGMIGGIQILNLQAPGCRYKGLYLHEIGHALGLVHEHQLPDRDNYIDILYHNVAPHMRIWFNKYTTKEVNQMRVPYELSSVMHYGITAFSKDGNSQTIRAKDQSKESTIGKVYLKELAYTDVMIVNKMYNCAKHCPNQNKCGGDGHLDQNCNCICRDGSQDCDKTKRNVDRQCKNEYYSWSCYIWANQGECTRNKFFMNAQCAKACGVCGNQADGTSAACKDVYKSSRCKVWKDRGECVTNTRWMRLNCKKTCGLCGAESTRPAVSCKDSHPEKQMCETGAGRGECKVNPQYMFKNCRKSCWMCDKDKPDGGDDGDGGDKGEDKCTNSHTSCEGWAKRGECKNNPTWMLPNCRMACGKCNDGTCKNLFDDVQCEIWAQKAHCVQNSEWMAENCAKACGRGYCDGKGGGSTSSPGKSTTKDPNASTTTSKNITPSKRPITTTSTTTGTSDCENVHRSDTECDIWAKNDHCNINPSWMLQFCAKACGKCGGKETQTTTKGSVDKDGGGESGKEEGCRDREDGCAEWAKHGYCNTNPRYNLVFCKKSCNNCNGCRDVEFLCSVWEKAGNCVRNPGYMLRYCQKSCKTCEM